MHRESDNPEERQKQLTPSKSGATFRRGPNDIEPHNLDPV